MFLGMQITNYFEAQKEPEKLEARGSRRWLRKLQRWSQTYQPIVELLGALP
jgi:hypothetical protein